VKFNFTSGLFSIIGNLVFMSIFIGRLGLPVGLANLASVAACSLVTFILADRIAFECNAT
jgi:putative flippase GtrA